MLLSHLIYIKRITFDYTPPLRRRDGQSEAGKNHVIQIGNYGTFVAQYISRIVDAIGEKIGQIRPILHRTSAHDAASIRVKY